MNISVLVLDNGSTVESYTKLQNISGDSLEIIRSEKNLGFAGGVNFSFLYLKKKYPDLKYIFLLNPDASIQKNTIYNLTNILARDKNIAAISPRIENFQGKKIYDGWWIDWKKCIISGTANKNHSLNTYPVDVFHGCAVLFDANKFYKVGMFHEEIFMYYDEAFLSQSFSKQSYTILCCNSSVAYHSDSYSAGSLSYLRAYYHTRNHLLFFKKFSKKSNIFCKYKAIIITLLSSIKHLHFHKLHGELKGILDFWFNKIGKTTNN